jgi:hypothetical protein
MKNQESKSTTQQRRTWKPELLSEAIIAALEEPCDVELFKALDNKKAEFLKMMAANGKLYSVSPKSEKMYDPQSETGARHWYYLNHMRIEHKTVAQTAPGADFIIGGRVKK